MRDVETPPRLGRYEIHVYHILLGPLGTSAGFAPLLAADELARADRFYRRVDRERFLRRCGCLRLLLARYLMQPAGSLRFVCSASGKPRLHGTGNLGFNVSHSHDVAAIAIAGNCEVGVDVEIVRPVPEMHAIADQNFHPDEKAAILQAGDHDRERAFFRCWTRKEAYLKATGEGLSDDLSRSCINMPDSAPARVILSAAPTCWMVEDIRAGPDCVAAVAYPDTAQVTRKYTQVSASELVGVG